jgi:beta-glucosidase
MTNTLRPIRSAKTGFVFVTVFLGLAAAAPSQEPVYKNPELDFNARAADLLSRMTIDEKILQLINDAPAIPRLGIPKYDWWSEALHGVARAGVATVFPQAIGLSATWNKGLIRQVADTISDEARAKFNEFVKSDIRRTYTGLTFWSPNINIFRDPRWGRGQETYGEDPYLTAELAVQFVKGLQGDDPRYLKAVATPKHYAVHSGPEKERHESNVAIGEKEMRETYLFAFKEAVKRADAQSVMCAYNRVNGTPACASRTLLIDFLRKEWGFSGYVVSDCDAIYDIYTGHKTAATAAEAAAAALKNGCDLNCGRTFEALKEALGKNLIDEKDIDTALRRLLLARLKLGLFDPAERVSFNRIGTDAIDSSKNRAMALQTARESIVLLKNENNVLPLKKDLGRLAIIGPNADNIDILLGNYFGTPSRYVTPLEGITSHIDHKTKIYYSKGCDIVNPDRRYFNEAVEMAGYADAVILFFGLSPKIEGEEGETQDADRKTLDLPGLQEELLQAIQKTGKPIVLVLLNGSPVSLNGAEGNIPAIVEAWYPGEEGGRAIADVIFGDYNPGGRLPVTFVKSLDQLPPFADYSMKGRTYRYMTEAPLYPFGFGLSYTSFSYSNLRLSSTRIETTESLKVEVDVENCGRVIGDEVVQLYISDLEASVPVPIRQLSGFERISLNPGEKRTISFTVTPRQLALIDASGACVLEPGRFQISVGGGQPVRHPQAAALNFLTATVDVTGKARELEY